MGTARPQLGQALALGAVTSTPGSWDATLLRSGATLATTTTTSAGTETTASSRGASGMAAPECVTCHATGILRNSATWEWTATTVSGQLLPGFRLRWMSCYRFWQRLRQLWLWLWLLLLTLHHGVQRHRDPLRRWYGLGGVLVRQLLYQPGERVGWLPRNVLHELQLGD